MALRGIRFLYIKTRKAKRVAKHSMKRLRNRSARLIMTAQLWYARLFVLKKMPQLNCRETKVYKIIKAHRF